MTTIALNKNEIACDLSSYFKYCPDSGKLYRDGTEVGTVRKDGYIKVSYKRNSLLAHRVAWVLHYGINPTGIIDHINGDKSDNRIVNLRLSNKSENGQNRKHCTKTNSTGYLGVHFHAGKFCASIKINGRKIHLGRFSTPEEAHAAYLEHKRINHKGNTL